MQTHDPFLNLLHLLAHEMMNGHPAFREPLAHTFVLSPYGSSCFGLSRGTGKVALGVPSELWDIVAGCRWQYIAKPRGDTALYMVATVHNQFKALRIHQRTARLNWLADINACQLMPLSPERVTLCKDGFSVAVRETDGLEWERLPVVAAPRIRGLDSLALLPRI